ncbi:hypothetical protein E4U56_004256 [Claviceps arundinis]|uniref:Uncharacterized protein n=1 Tax=Claviceps arundinis TaxID=1623583 RepID=A0A9P7SL63_9HYPO|nr:hypothetical protein E4U56_004256 [Claviceps arundinis]
MWSLSHRIDCGPTHHPLLRRSARRSKGKPDETPTSRQPDVQPSGIWDPDILHDLVRLFPILHGASAIVFCLKTPCSFLAWQSQPACLPTLEQQCSWCTPLTRIPRLSDSESAPSAPISSAHRSIKLYQLHTKRNVSPVLSAFCLSRTSRDDLWTQFRL